MDVTCSDPGAAPSGIARNRTPVACFEYSARFSSILSFGHVRTKPNSVRFASLP